MINKNNISKTRFNTKLPQTPVSCKNIDNNPSIREYIDSIYTKTKSKSKYNRNNSKTKSNKDYSVSNKQKLTHNQVKQSVVNNNLDNNSSNFMNREFLVTSSNKSNLPEEMMISYNNLNSQDLVSNQDFSQYDYNNKNINNNNNNNNSNIHDNDNNETTSIYINNNNFNNNFSYDDNSQNLSPIIQKYQSKDSKGSKQKSLFTLASEEYLKNFNKEKSKSLLDMIKDEDLLSRIFKTDNKKHANKEERNSFLERNDELAKKKIAYRKIEETKSQNSKERFPKPISKNILKRIRSLDKVDNNKVGNNTIKEQSLTIYENTTEERKETIASKNDTAEKNDVNTITNTKANNNNRLNSPSALERNNLFYQEQQQHQREQKARLNELLKKKEDKIKSACSFKPTIDSYSKKIIDEKKSMINETQPNNSYSINNNTSINNNNNNNYSNYINYSQNLQEDVFNRLFKHHSKSTLKRKIFNNGYNEIKQYKSSQISSNAFQNNNDVNPNTDINNNEKMINSRSNNCFLIKQLKNNNINQNNNKDSDIKANYLNNNLTTKNSQAKGFYKKFFDNQLDKCFDKDNQRINRQSFFRKLHIYNKSRGNSQNNSSNVSFNNSNKNNVTVSNTGRISQRNNNHNVHFTSTTHKNDGNVNRGYSSGLGNNRNSLNNKYSNINKSNNISRYNSKFSYSRGTSPSGFYDNNKNSNTNNNYYRSRSNNSDRINKQSNRPLTSILKYNTNSNFKTSKSSNVLLLQKLIDEYELVCPNYISTEEEFYNLMYRLGFVKYNHLKEINNKERNEIIDDCTNNRNTFINNNRFEIYNKSSRVSTNKTITKYSNYGSNNSNNNKNSNSNISQIKNKMLLNSPDYEKESLLLKQAFILITKLNEMSESYDVRNKSNNNTNNISNINELASMSVFNTNTNNENNNDNDVFSYTEETNMLMTNNTNNNKLTDIIVTSSKTDTNRNKAQFNQGNLYETIFSYCLMLLGFKYSYNSNSSFIIQKNDNFSNKYDSVSDIQIINKQSSSRNFNQYGKNNNNSNIIDKEEALEENHISNIRKPKQDFMTSIIKTDNIQSNSTFLQAKNSKTNIKEENHNDNNNDESNNKIVEANNNDDLFSQSDFKFSSNNNNLSLNKLIQYTKYSDQKIQDITSILHLFRKKTLLFNFNLFDIRIISDLINSNSNNRSNNNNNEFLIKLPSIVRTKYYSFSSNRQSFLEKQTKEKNKIKIVSIKKEYESNMKPEINKDKIVLGKDPRSRVYRRYDNDIVKGKSTELTIGDLAQIRSRKKNNDIIKAVQEKARIELNECTFKPQLSPVPKYLMTETTHITDYYTKKKKYYDDVENISFSNKNNSILNTKVDKSEIISNKPNSLDKSRILNSTFSFQHKRQELTNNEKDYLRQKDELTFKPQINQIKEIKINIYKKNPLLNDTKLQKSLEKRKIFFEQKKLETMQKDLCVNSIKIVKNVMLRKNLSPNHKTFSTSQEKMHYNYNTKNNTRSLSSSASKDCYNSTVSDSFNKAKPWRQLNLKKIKNNDSYTNTTEPLSTRRQERPLFTIKIEITENVSEIVDFYSYQAIDNVAYDIALKHNLKGDKVHILKNILKENYDRVMNE